MLILNQRVEVNLNRSVWVLLRGWLCVWLVFSVPVTSYAESVDFEVVSIEPHWVEGVYQISAVISYALSPEALEALESGVTLTFSVDIIISRARKYWFDENVVVLKQQYQLRYHALSDQYILTNVNSGAVNSFPNLRGALVFMGSLVDLPLIDDKFLNASFGYVGRLRARLDIDSLPTPLRLLAYVTSGWRLTSEWQLWNVFLREE